MCCARSWAESTDSMLERCGSGLLNKLVVKLRATISSSSLDYFQ